MKHIKFLGTGGGDIDNGVHFPSTNGGDYTLCGLTLDGDPCTAGDYVETDERVDCDQCIAIVNFCKAIKKREFL